MSEEVKKSSSHCTVMFCNVKSIDEQEIEFEED
jgi:hypothetical protein